jgi:hypothetical protein
MLPLFSDNCASIFTINLCPALFLAFIHSPKTLIRLQSGHCLSFIFASPWLPPKLNTKSRRRTADNTTEKGKGFMQG